MLQGFLSNTFEPSNLYDGHNITQLSLSGTVLHIISISSGNMSGRSIGKTSDASALAEIQNSSAMLTAELTKLP